MNSFNQESEQVSLLVIDSSDSAILLNSIQAGRGNWSLESKGFIGDLSKVDQPIIDAMINDFV